jgi:hypothetical protein
MVVRAMVGHSSEEMTQHYSEAETEEMRAASEQHIAPIFDLVQKRISLSADQTGVVTGVGDNNSDDAELRKAVNGDVSTLTSRSRNRPNDEAAAGLTQLVECQLPKLNVAGSSPVSRSR